MNISVSVPADGKVTLGLKKKKEQSFFRYILLSNIKYNTRKGKTDFSIK